VDHVAHAASERRVVTGKVCAPPDIEPGVLQSMLDQAMAKAQGTQLCVPELVSAAGDDKRAEVERRRYAMLVGNAG
jgi:hypothetical protein